ncbi:MAG: serine hydrolase domain-containing protein [Ilumatobacteraceae bacterium]
MPSEAALPISGWCDPAFAAVRDAFVDNFRERGELGAACTVVIGDRTVVDLVGGWRDDARTVPWDHDTLVNVYSAGKGLLALVALQAVDRGEVDLDEPIARRWPEFAAGGKEAATLRHALTHQAGVPAISRLLTNDDLWDWATMTEALAATEAWFEPGSRITYHTNTFGHLVGEVARRATGRMPGALLREVAAPLGADTWWGVPLADQARCADVRWAPSSPIPDPDWATLEGPGRMLMLGYFNPPGYSSHGVVNTTAWRSAQVPSTNCHSTAAGLARIYRALVEPGRLLSPALLQEATSVQAAGPCPVLGEDIAVGLGFVPTSERRPLGTNPHSFGHFGTGGALGFGDPDAQLGFGYVMNDVIPRWQSTRNRTLIDALYASL